MLILGDCLTVMRTMDANSVSAIVTDPPAGISFMNAEWDHHKGGRQQWIAWMTEVMQEALRVIKPGGHGFVWALPRTSHWTATAIEDAGWDVRDIVTHITASGFPKSQASLKPASEHWILCRKPISESNVAANVARWGTGNLQIDASRIGTDSTIATHRAEMGYGGGNLAPEYTTGNASGRWPANVTFEHVSPDADGNGGCEAIGTRRVKGSHDTTGVWSNGKRPSGFAMGGAVTQGYAAADGTEEIVAFACVPGCAVAELDRQATGTRASKASGNHVRHNTPEGVNKDHSYGRSTEAWQTQGYTDAGASRFFFVAKPSRAERERGLTGMPTQFRATLSGESTPRTARDGKQRNGAVRANIHPTVKSIALMRHLLTLVVPPNGTVLDPFAGSGSTIVAAIELGMDWIGVEQSPEYHAIAAARILDAELRREAEDAIPLLRYAGIEL